MAAIGGITMLGREQRMTTGQGRPARPRRIALWVATVVIGLVVAVVAILVA